MDESKRFSELLGNFLDETAVTLSTLSNQCQNFANQCEKEGLIPPHPGNVQRALLALMENKQDFDLLYIGGKKPLSSKKSLDTSSKTEPLDQDQLKKFLKTPLPEDIKIDPKTPEVLAQILQVVSHYPNAPAEYLTPNLKYEFPGLTEKEAEEISECFVPIVSKVLK